MTSFSTKGLVSSNLLTMFDWIYEIIGKKTKLRFEFTGLPTHFYVQLISKIIASSKNVLLKFFNTGI